uniref:Uncharacterized protein n=1 Tax=Glossina brevipalpis TaxID=37001 RepID=A0A1A9W079_9MUSC
MSSTYIVMHAIFSLFIKLYIHGSVLGRRRCSEEAPVKICFPMDFPKELLQFTSSIRTTLLSALSASYSVTSYYQQWNQAASYVMKGKCRENCKCLLLLGEKFACGMLTLKT